MDNYRLLARKDEIFKMVKKAPVIEIGEVWQTLPLKREVYRIKKLDILDECMIFVTTLPFDFDPNFPIYIKLNYKNLVFKLAPGEFRSSKNQLTCGYPKEAKAIEDRSVERTKFPSKTQLNVTLRSLGSSTSIDIKVNIADISSIGIGIRTSSVNREYFARNSNFIITKICGREHYEQTVLTVKHISSGDERAYLGIGLQGSHPFSDKTFQVIREEMTRVKYVQLKGL